MSPLRGRQDPGTIEPGTSEPGPGRAASILLLVTVCFILVQLWASFRASVTDDEQHYFFVAHQIVENGDWLTPYDQFGRLRLHKPPLTTWLTASVFKLTGSRIYAARLVSILAGVLAGWALYLLAGVLFGSRRTALLAGIMLLGLTEFNLNCGQARPDPLLLFLLIAANYCLARVVLGKSRPLLFTLLGFALAGLGFLAKGPYGLLLTLPVPIITALIHKELRPNLKHFKNPLIWLLPVAVIVPWYAALIGVHGSGIWSKIMGDISKNGPDVALFSAVLKNIHSFANSGAVIALPWWPLLFVYLAARRRPEFSEQRRKSPASMTYVWIWLIIAALALLPNKSNYNRYVLTLFPGLTLIGAHVLGSAWEARGWVRERAIPILVWGLGLIYLVWTGLLGYAWLAHGENLSDPYNLLLPAFLILAGLLGLLVWQWRKRNPVWVVLALTCMSIVANGVYARDFSVSAGHGAMDRMARTVLREKSPDQERLFDLAMKKSEWVLVLESLGYPPTGRFHWIDQRIFWPRQGIWEQVKAGQEILFLANSRETRKLPPRFLARFEMLARVDHHFLKAGRGILLQPKTESAFLYRLRPELD